VWDEEQEQFLRLLLVSAAEASHSSSQDAWLHHTQQHTDNIPTFIDQSFRYAKMLHIQITIKM